jgi:hypothetical protein
LVKPYKQLAWKQGVLSGAMIKCKSETGFIPLEEKKMANLTPRQVMDRLKQEGLFLVKEGRYFFIPGSELKQFALPDEFQDKFADISGDYFEKKGLPPEGFEPKSAVFKGINRVLGNARVVDGIEQAVLLRDADDVGVGQDSKFVSMTSQSDEVIFVYNTDHTKITVDMTKGGRPSDD